MAVLGLQGHTAVVGEANLTLNVEPATIDPNPPFFRVICGGEDREIRTGHTE